MFVTLKVFKLIGPSNDGRRHGRGTFLFFVDALCCKYRDISRTPKSIDLGVLGYTKNCKVDAPYSYRLVIRHIYTLR
jgi:hypothetical protein